MKLKFLGGTGTVTGSKYILEGPDSKVLIDCGLFQGRKDFRLKNWESFPEDVRGIDHMILTHAHIDHSGYIPAIVRQGFTGNVYCSQATLDLCKILLPDSAHLQEEEAEYANRKHYSKHTPALPIYTSKDVEKALTLFKSTEYKEALQITKDFKFELYPAGHILGASSIRLKTPRSSIVFSGDLGRYDDLIMKEPVTPEPADYVVIESTYGDRLHDQEFSVKDKLSEIINRTVERGGTVIIPSFAVGRAQLLLFLMSELKREKKIPDILPVFLNSPMAISASKIFYQHRAEHRLTDKETLAACNVARYVRSVDESIQLNNLNGPKVIISASGMATGGRVLHHLKTYIGDSRNTVLFCGFQTPGTRGEKLLNGAETIKIHGAHYPVRADIEFVDTLSAHGDQKDLVKWLTSFKKPPKKIFITHGEVEASRALKKVIESTVDAECIIPGMYDVVDLP